MATKRIAQSSINWAALAERVPPNQKTNFQTFKTKSDVYIRSVLANPENPPKIDWAYYKSIIPVPGMVDKFKQQYESLKIPFPADSVTAQVEAQAKETAAEIDSFKKASNSRIAAYQKDIEHLKSLLPYDQMTMEDYRDAFPDEALDPINRPTFWPHDAEEQLGHVDKNAPAHGGH